MRISHQLINASASSAPITRNSLPGSNPSRHFPQQEPSRNRAAANDDHLFIPTRLKPVEVPPKHHADCECVRKSEPEHDENKPGQQNARQQQIWLVVPHDISMLRRNTGGVPHNCRNQGITLIILPSPGHLCNADLSFIAVSAPPWRLGFRRCTQRVMKNRPRLNGF